MLERHPQANPLTGVVAEVTALGASSDPPADDSASQTDQASHKDLESGSLSESKGDHASSHEVQDGVRQAEAITATWSKTSLRTAYLLCASCTLKMSSETDHAACG
jgi:hypothetical protein